MNKDTRLDQIVKICEKSGFASYKTLANTLNVSEITIRRDIDLLETLKLINKEKGGAVVRKSQVINDFLHYNIEDSYHVMADEKKRIGEKAISLIQPGETIIFDSGATLYYMSTLLPNRILITAICYGLKIAEVLNEKQITQLVLIGGIYHKDTDMYESIDEYNVFKNIRAQKAFISAFGIHKQAGLTSGSFFASSLRTEIIAASDKVILLADSTKFGKMECAHFADLKDIDTIITDQGIQKDYIDLFNEIDIPLIIV